MQQSEQETIWHLETLMMEELRPKALPQVTQLVKFGPALPAMKRFFIWSLLNFGNGQASCHGQKNNIRTDLIVKDIRPECYFIKVNP